MEITSAVLIERARALASEISGKTAEIDEGSKLPDALVEKLVESGLISALVPKKFGGSEMGLDTVSEIVRIFAAVSPSVAWVLSFYIGHNWMHCQFPEKAQQEIFASGPNAMSAGVLAPLYGVVPVEGGYRVTGRTSWNSGAPHADWFMSGGLVMEEGKPPRPLIFILPRHEVSLNDNWDVMAMRSTGSWEVALNDVFIPDHRTVSAVDLMQGNSPGSLLHENPAYSRPLILISFAYVVPMIVGATRGVMNEFLLATAKRAGTNDGSKAILKPAVQMRAGRGEARITLAETMCDELVRSVMDPNAVSRFTVAERLAFRARAAMIVEFCRETVNDLVLGSGANAFRRESRLQMIFRDINMVSVHAFFEPEGTTESYGRVLLGLEPQGPI